MASSYEIEVTLTGRTPMLMHNDDVMAADDLEAWRNDEKNAGLQKRGDDRTPPWTWQTYLYTDSEHIAIPSTNLMSALSRAGGSIVVKAPKTLKEFTQNSIDMDEEFATFLVGGKQIEIAPLAAVHERPFIEHVGLARKLGFDLFIKRAKVGASKHVRVRPRFDEWQLKFRATIANPDVMTHDRIRRVFDVLGAKGLGDWRPSAPRSGGPFGKSIPEVKFL